MNFTLVNNQITFNKGGKPRQVWYAQHEAWDIYSFLCKEKAPYHRSAAKEMMLASLGDKRDSILKYSPHYMVVIESAVQAYVGIKDKLYQRKMFSLNLYVQVEDLPLFKVSEGVIQAAREAGLTEVVLMAKEVPNPASPA